MSILGNAKINEKASKYDELVLAQKAEKMADLRALDLHNAYLEKQLAQYQAPQRFGTPQQLPVANSLAAQGMYNG